VLGGSTFGYAATAEPGSGVWDIEDYEDCILRETLKTSDGVLTCSVVRSRAKTAVVSGKTMEVWQASV
jgi:hypothetical protein